MIPNNNSWNSRSTGSVKGNYLWWNDAVFVDIQSGIRIAHKLVKFRFTESHFCWHRTFWTIIYLISSGIQLYMAITSCNSFNEMLPSRFWSETMMIAGNRKSLARVIWIWWLKWRDQKLCTVNPADFEASNRSTMSSRVTWLKWLRNTSTPWRSISPGWWAFCKGIFR